MLNIALAIIIVFGLRTINSKKVRLSITFLVTVFVISFTYLGYVICNSILGSLFAFILSYIVLVSFIKITERSKLFLYLTFLLSNLLAIVLLLSDNFNILKNLVNLKVLDEYSYIFVIMFLSFGYCFVYYKKSYFNEDINSEDKIENKFNIKTRKVQNKKISV